MEGKGGILVIGSGKDDPVWFISNNDRDESLEQVRNLQFLDINEKRAFLYPKYVKYSLILYIKYNTIKQENRVYGNLLSIRDEEVI